MAVFPRESTVWRADRIGGHPDKVVLHVSDVGGPSISVHLDRVTIEGLQAALSDALAVLEPPPTVSAA